ncbi:MAG: hypothetical protein ABIK73_07215 [candidate division WOR-3 bacterium]
MAFLLFGVENVLENCTKLNLLVSKYRLIVVSRREYSVYDPITKTRCLYKIFGTKEGKFAFDYSSKYDVFRVLSLYLQKLVDAALASGFMTKPDYIEDFVCFVSSPVLPVMYQQVGLGIPHDVVFNGKPYKQVDECLPYGYDIVFDMRNVYKLGDDKIRYIPVHYGNKDILVPSLSKLHGMKISGYSAIMNKEVEYDLNELWFIPRAQYVKWETIKQKLPWILKKRVID